jgi:hypothetical protein
MRNLARYLLPCLTIALDSPKPEQKKAFGSALQCVNGLVNFCLMAQYRTHTAGTLVFMQRYLKQFHDNRSVFDEFRTSAAKRKIVKEKAKEIRRQMLGKGAEDDEVDSENSGTDDTNAEDTPEEDEVFEEDGAGASSAESDEAPNPKRIRTSAQRFRYIKNTRQFIREMEREMTANEAHYNLIKLHLCTHFAETVVMYGSLQQWSTETPETLHKEVKGSFRRAVDEKKQIAIRLHRKASLRLRELNIIYLARRGIKEADAQEAFNLYAEKTDRLCANRRNRLGDYGIKANITCTAESEDIVELLNNTVATLSLAADQQHTPGDFLKYDTHVETSGNVSSQHDDKMEETDHIGTAIRVIPSLFTETTTKCGWRLQNAVATRARFDIESLSTRYRVPGLTEALAKFLRSYFRDKEREFHAGALSSQSVGNCKATAFNILEIRSLAFQSQNEMEIQRAECTGHLLRRKRIRNDSVWYTLTRDEKPPDDYNNYELGKLACLFTITLPKPEIWEPGISPMRYADDDCEHISLAFIEQLNINEPKRYMNPVSEVGTCKPAGLVHGGVVVEIQKIVRIAHLIPFHSQEIEEEGGLDRYWVINNRIDLMTFDFAYKDRYQCS